MFQIFQTLLNKEVTWLGLIIFFALNYLLICAVGFFIFKKFQKAQKHAQDILANQLKNSFGNDCDPYKRKEIETTQRKVEELMKKWGLN